MPLQQTAQQLVAESRGILASDESINTLNQKFASLNIEQSPEMRRRYREIFLTTPNLSRFLNGVILSEETMQQVSSNNTPFPEVLHHQGVIVGVKLDQGTRAVPRFPNETITLGLDELEGKIKLYKQLGAQFVKWRSVFRIGDGIPTDTMLRANAQALSLYALYCQDQDLVPILEPEILMAGNHDAQRCETETLRMLTTLFREIDSFRVEQSQIIIKTNMVLPGLESHQVLSAEEVAEMTVRVLRQGIPDEVPGVVFLSGGQTREEAITRLSAIMKYPDLPWRLTFSFLRAIEQSALEFWRGDPDKVDAARVEFLSTLEETVSALKGSRTP